ncbi:MAG: SapC family protein [Pseudomonadota bacterium]
MTKNSENGAAAAASPDKPPADQQDPAAARAVPLSAERHGKLRLRRSATPYGFASGANLVALTFHEFPAAALSYPIVFAGPNKTPCAVMGFESGENLFIDAKGAPTEGVYIPASLRGHPFIAAPDTKEDRLVLMIDPSSDRLSEKEGEPLFGADRKPTDMTQGALTFLGTLRARQEETLAFVEELQALDLFEEKELRTRDEPGAGEDDASEGGGRVLARYISLSGDKLDALSAEDLRRIGKPGRLRAVYAQILSLGQWAPLGARAVARRRETKKG